MKSKLKYSAIAAAILSSHSAWSANALEEVVVTAQFKEQTLQDTGIAIDALDNEKMIKSGVTSASELAELIPALTITNGGGIASQLYMRGVGNTANNNYLDPAIILTYDGVPIARGSAASIGGFYDLQRVEVLKGPQGTLYGKNATGGVLSMIPAKPVLGETSGFVNGSYGNYDAIQLSGAINLPVGDNSALRLSASVNNRDGYNSDGTSDDDRTAFRVQFYTEINENLDIRLAADTTDIGGVGNSGDIIGHYSPGAFELVTDGPEPGTGMLSDEAGAYRTTVLSAPGFGFLTPIQDAWSTDATLSGFNAEINYKTDLGLLTIVPAYREQEQESLFGGPGFNSGSWNNSADQTTLEVRLQGEGETMEYLAGIFYFEENVEGNNTFNQEFVLPLQDYELTSDSWAAFTQLTWNLTDKSRLITGARYTEDKRDIDGVIENFIVFCGGPGPGLITPPGSFAQGCAAPGGLPHFPTLDTPEEAAAFLVDNGWTASGGFGPNPTLNGVGTVLHTFANNQQDYSSEELTWRIAYEQDILQDSLFYASFETGYRAGGLEPNGNTYEPEYLDAYTVGMKNRFLDGSLQVNLELFHWKYEDQQISYFTVSNNTLQNIVDNVGKSTNQGADIDVLWQIAENTLISSKIQWLDNSYDDLHFTTQPPRNNINCPVTDTGVIVAGNPVLDFDCSGNQSIYSPDLTLQFGIEHTVPMGAVNLIFSIDTSWVDDQVTGFQNLPHEVIEDHWKTNLDITLASTDDTWSVSAYARNLEDERRLQSTQSPLLGMAIGQFSPDMTYGMRFSYNF